MIKTTECVEAVTDAEVCEVAAVDAETDAGIDDGGGVGDPLAAEEERAVKRRRLRVDPARAVVFGVVPALALLAAVAAGFFKFQDSSAHAAAAARIESVQAATEGTIKMLSYRPDTVEQDLASARDLMTGALRDSYGSFTHDVVIPGAKEKKITAVATVPAAASVSATCNQAVALVFVNQTTTMGTEPPTNLVSSVRVALAKVGGRWLMSEFTPV